jgi:hypothetical protein
MEMFNFCIEIGRLMDQVFSQSPDFHCGYPISTPGQCMWKTWVVSETDFSRSTSLFPLPMLHNHTAFINTDTI